MQADTGDPQVKIKSTGIFLKPKSSSCRGSKTYTKEGVDEGTETEQDRHSSTIHRQRGPWRCWVCREADKTKGWTPEVIRTRDGWAGSWTTTSQNSGECRKHKDWDRTRCRFPLRHCYCHCKSWTNNCIMCINRPWRCNRGLWHLWVRVCTGENGINTGIYLQNKPQILWNSFTCILILYPQVSCRSLARLETIQDMHTTIYDVIRHAPESPSQSLLEWLLVTGSHYTWRLSCSFNSLKSLLSKPKALGFVAVF